MFYLDNASTTKPSEAAKNAFLNACESFGNPSSLHRIGLSAEKIIDGARQSVAKALNVKERSIYFTSGGTEANNLAILGYCRANRKRGTHIITTRLEHPSVLAPFAQLEKEGFSVSYINSDSDGIIDMDMLENAIDENTLFVSVMAANNETGAIMPINKIKEIIKSKGSEAVLHADAVQAFGKIPLKPIEWGIDMMSVSAHKIHGVKGCGALYTSTEHILPILFGGGQQRDLRSGTENVPGISAFGAAASEINTDNSKMLKMRMKFKEAIAKRVENVTFNGSDEFQTGYVLNVSFAGIKAEILLHMLEAKGIYVSTGSACSSNKPMPSHVLSAMGVSSENINGAVRMSFSELLEDDEIEQIADETAKCVAEVRKYVR